MGASAFIFFRAFLLDFSLAKELLVPASYISMSDRVLMKFFSLGNPSSCILI